jgi:hypothetical protein
MANYIISGAEISKQLCGALGLDPNLVRRIVLDFGANDPVTAYVEMYGDERMLDIQWTFDGSKIELVEKAR